MSDAVSQVIGGCVSQLGMQASNVVRNAWLGARLPLAVPATTMNTQCGSSQEATTLAHALLAAGFAEVVVACGVESMSQIPLGASAPGSPDYSKPRGGRYPTFHEPTTQFEGAERIAEAWGFAREELEAFGKRSQDLAAAARLHLDILGAAALVGADESGPLGNYLHSRAMTIYGGSAQVQRNIIAQRVLGMPTQHHGR